MSITYTAAVDLNHDGDFIDLNEAISADVIALEWRIGMAQAYDDVGAPSWARVTIRNPTQRYSPESVSGLDLLPGARLRIQSTFSSVTYTHFTGVIARVEPDGGTLGSRESLIVAEGLEAQLAAAEIRLPPLVDVRADQVIDAVLNAAPLRRPVLAGSWVLNVPGYSTLEVSTRLFGFYPRALEMGKSTFAYIGDTWGDGLPALQAIRQIVASELGRFFFNRAGEAVFLNRHFTLLLTTPAAAFSENPDALDYRYGGDLANRVTLRVRPRSIGSTSGVLWRIDTAQILSPGAVREVIVRFRDDDLRQAGALTVYAPLAGVDYVANSAANGAGQDLTAKVVVRLVRADFSAALLRLENTSGLTAYILTGMQVRGVPLVQQDPLVVERTDATSLSFHGLRPLQLDTPALNSGEEGEQIVRYELARRKDPRGVISAISVRAPKHLPHLLARTLFDRITVSDAQTGHSGDYFIVAEQHRVDRGGTRHRAIWTLEPAEASRFWLLNTHALNQTALLAY